MKRSVRLFIKGSVQGIFFRQFIKENADKQGIKGHVRNLEDGRVEVFIEGDQDKVDSMISLCKQGPQHSQIRGVEEKEERFQDFKDFRIIRF